jgi:hypothetical protein
MLSLYPNFFLEMIVAYHINLSLSFSKKKKRKKKEKRDGLNPKLAIGDGRTAPNWLLGVGITLNHPFPKPSSPFFGSLPDL